MAFIGKQVTVNGVIYTPLSADPSNPKEGQVYFSDGTVRVRGLWVYKNSNWSQIGTAISDKSVYGQFDAEDKSIINFTNISITTVNPINEENSYSVDSFPASLPALSLNERNKNKENAVSIQYTMASGSAKLLIKDQSNNTLGEVIITSSTVVSTAIITYYTDPTITSVVLEIEDVSSATDLVIDDVIFSDDPFIYKNIQEENSFSASIQNNGTASIISQGGNSIQSVSRSAAGIVNITFVAGFFTAAPDIVVSCLNDLNRRSAGVTTTSSTSATIRTFDTSDNSNEDLDFTISITRSDSDFKNSTKNIITPTQVTLTNWTPYTPVFNGVGTPTNVDVWYKQVGDEYKIQGTITLDNPTASEARMSLPNAHTVKSVGALVKSSGSWFRGVSSNDSGGSILCTQGDNFVNFGAKEVFSDTATNALTPSNGSDLGADGNVISFFMTIPINELSSTINFLTATPTVSQTIKVVDGVSEPDTILGVGSIYIDSLDGDLKIKFADGTIKTIVTDT